VLAIVPLFNKASGDQWLDVDENKPRTMNNIIYARTKVSYSWWCYVPELQKLQCMLQQDPL